MSRSRFAEFLLLLPLMACSDQAAPPSDACQVAELPVSGGPDAPLVTDVALEPRANGITALATASDPQGSRNLRDVLQTIKVFQDAGCQASPIVIQDDLASSGMEEEFGTVVAASNQPLYAAIAAAESWPVAIDFRDADDHTTSAHVLARVIHP
jgi:hypothetical protein